MQLITEATRIAKTTAALLDHIYCSSRTMISGSDVITLHLSDHHAVFCNMSSVFQANSSQRSLLTNRHLGRVDCEALAKDMSSQPWSILESSGDVDDITNYFTQLFIEAWNRHAPVKKKPMSAQKPPWLTTEIFDMMRSRDKLYDKFRRCKTDVNWLIYKQSRNRCIAAVRTAKRNFLMDCIKRKQKQFWRFIKSCSSLGKLKNSSLPWPCSCQAISKSSANAVNEHFVCGAISNTQQQSSIGQRPFKQSVARHLFGVLALQ